MRAILLFFLILLILPSQGSAGGALPWQHYYFDGKAFRPGASPSGSSITCKDGYLPERKPAGEMFREYGLPAGAGGVVIFCYIESAGGKLQNHAGTLPAPGTPVEISGGNQSLVVRTDQEGYAILALAAGEYDIQVPGYIGKIHIEKNKTVFVPIRAGKRMID